MAHAALLNSAYIWLICQPAAVLFRLLAYITLMPLTRYSEPRLADQRKATTLHVTASMDSTVKPMAGWVDCEASKSAREANVVEPRGTPASQLMLSDVSVKLTARMLLAVALL